MKSSIGEPCVNPLPMIISRSHGVVAKGVKIVFKEPNTPLSKLLSARVVEKLVCSVV